MGSNLFADVLLQGIDGLIRHCRLTLRLVLGGYVKAAASVLVVAVWFFVQRLLVMIEAWWLSRNNPRGLQPVRPVFIIGLQRSATTTVHETLLASSHGRLRSMSYFDMLLPSTFARTVSAPICSILRFCLSRLDTPGHRVGESMLFEEQGLNLSDDMLLLLAPQLLCVPNEDLLRFDNSHVAYAKLCIARWLMAQPGARYLGKPLGWTVSLSDARNNAITQEFPDAEFIVCTRDPRTAFMSYMTLCYHMRYHKYPRLFDRFCSIMWRRYWLPATQNILALTSAAPASTDQQQAPKQQLPNQNTILHFQEWCAGPESRNHLVACLRDRHQLPLIEPFCFYADGKSPPLPPNMRMVVEQSMTAVPT